MTLRGKYWYLDLLEFILSLNFTPSKNVPCLLIFVGKNGLAELPWRHAIFWDWWSGNTTIRASSKRKVQLGTSWASSLVFSNQDQPTIQFWHRVGSEQILSGNLKKISGHSRYKMQSTITQHSLTVRICPYNWRLQSGRERINSSTSGI